MHKRKKTKTMKKKYRNCAYTDEAKRLIRYTRKIRIANKKQLNKIKSLAS